MFKKILASVATAALALVMVFTGAVSANATHTSLSISADVSCTSDFKYQVTWSVANNAGLTETITSSSDTSLVPVGETLTAGQTKTYTEVLPGVTNKTLTLSGQWSDGATNSDSKTLADHDFPSCVPNRNPVTICHATPPDTAAQGWVSETIDGSGAILSSQHQTQHDKDIIPSFVYWEQIDGVWTPFTYPGKNLTTDFSGFTGSEILASDCSPGKTATAPVFQPATCTDSGDTTDGSYTIPSTDGVVYSVRLNGAGPYVETAAGTYSAPVGTQIQVKAEGDPSWIVLNGTTSWSYTVPAPDSACLILVTPVAPTVTPVAECGVDGSVVLPTTTGVVYELTFGNGLYGPYTVTATPDDGYKFAGNQIVTFSGDLGAQTFASDCYPVVTPVAPTVTPVGDCGVDGSIVLPTTTGVVYELTLGNGLYGAYTVTATPADGYKFAGDQVVTFSGDLGDQTFKSDCEVFIDTDPTASSCLSFDQDSPFTSWIRVSLDPRLIYTIDGNVVTSEYTEVTPGSHTVQATAADGFILEPDPSTWTFDVQDTEQCLPTSALVTPIESSTQLTCDEPGSFTIGALDEGTVSWTVNGVPTAAGTYPVSTEQELTLVAEPTLEADGLDPDWTNPLVLDFTFPEGCDLKTLAFTGGNDPLGLALIAGLLGLGGLGCYVAFRRFAAS
ncbi:MAG: hypothetical protein EPN91_07810 [Salinibacterium sp.]|nr:MAG: hypothetical protein EPN91_07810 [Salinibacterium sp.]